MNRSDVSIIIPVWGPPELSWACLRAIHETAPDAEVVVVDNTGTFEPEYPVDVFLPQAENLGCTGAKILGVEKSTRPLVCFLDCDTEAQPRWLDALLTAFDDPQVAMAGPTLRYPNGAIQCAGITTYHGNGSAGGANRQDAHPSNSDEDGCTGAAMAVRRSVYEEVGGIDPRFLNGYDDVWLDLCVKEAGYKIAYVAESEVIHHESSTGPERWTFAGQNVALMNELWGSR